MGRKTHFEQAVIFAGGRGDRLRPLTDSLPKPMAPVLGRPFTDYLLKALIDSGIRKVLFLTGYLSEKIETYYRDQLPGGIKVAYSVGAVEDQTGRRLLNAFSLLDDKFLLLYGDNYWPVPLKAMSENYDRLGLPVTTTVFRNTHGTGEYGHENNVIVEPSGHVRAYDKSRKAQGLNGIDIGFFLVSKDALDPKEQGNISFEEIILTRLARQGRLGAFLTDEQYYYITSLETLRRFEQIVREQNLALIER